MDNISGVRPRELARRLGLPPSTIYEQIRRGRLPAVRFGRALVILAADLDAYLERHRQGGHDGR